MQILNLSVCGGEGNDISPTGNGKTIGELNQIDCLVEYVSEIILDRKNSIKETGLHNTNGNHSLVLKHFSLKLYSQTFTLKISPPACVGRLIVLYKEHFLSQFFKEVIPQPPNKLALQA